MSLEERILQELKAEVAARADRRRRARTARRLGATDALVIYRRTREKMPAADVEVEEALAEGVRIRWLSTIAYAGENAVTVERMRLDEDGRPQPTGELEELPADSVVLAIGQAIDPSILSDVDGISVVDGLVQVGPDFMTGRAGVFAGGDVATNDRTVTAAVASGLVLGLGIVWYAAITPRMERAMVPYDADAVDPPMAQNEQRFVYRLRVDVSTNPELWATYTTKIGMPTCPELEAFTADTHNWRGREWAEAYRRCPALVGWVQERKNRYFWTDLVTADPALFAKTFFRQLSLTLGGEVYADVPRVVPFEKLAFPSRRFGLPLALLGFAAAFALAWWAGALRSHRRLVWFAVGVFAAALLSATATIVMVTGELQRFGVQETIATRVAMLILLGCALDAWLSRRGLAEDQAGVSSTGAARPGPAQAAA